LLSNGISVENSTGKFYISGVQVRLPQIALLSIRFYILWALTRQFNRTKTLNIETLNLKRSEKTGRNDDYDDKKTTTTKNNRTRVTATNTAAATTTTTTRTTTTAYIVLLLPQLLLTYYHYHYN
jgi:hypothetical protein